MRKIQQGFTLIELMIVVAIIGILAAVAIPNYQTYTKKAKFTEVVQAATPYKTAIEVAVQGGQITAKTSMDAGSYGIPAAIGTGTGKVASVSLTDGVITVTGTADVDSKTFVLEASGVTLPIQWSKSGTCVAASLC